MDDKRKPHPETLDAEDDEAATGDEDEDEGEDEE
jgi:hypothetical protein